MKKIIALSCLLILISCTSRAIFDNSKNQYIAAKIHLNNVKIKINDRKIWPLHKAKNKYLTEEEVAELTKCAIIKKLQEDGFYSDNIADDVLKYDLSINYDRMFMMFTDHAYIGTALRSYEINVYENSKLIATKFSKKRKTADLDFSEKIKKIGKSITFSYDQDNEKNEILVFAGKIAEEMEKIIVQ